MRAVLLAITRIPGVMAWRNNAGSFVTQAGSRVRASVPGAPDIIAIFRGRFIGLECKTETGRQSDQQRAFQRACEQAGGIYAIVRSAPDALEIIACVAAEAADGVSADLHVTP